LPELNFDLKNFRKKIKTNLSSNLIASNTISTVVATIRIE